MLNSVDHNPCVGVMLSNTLSLDNHINNSTAKATRTLGFLRRNLDKCPTYITKQAYVSLVRPTLEYARSVCDPHIQKHANQLEMVQRRAARFIGRQYSRYLGTVPTLLEDLALPTLQERRNTSRLLFFYI